MSACCEVANGRNTPTWGRNAREFCKWAIPGALWALLPKCPACVAAHIAIATGLGLSLTAASFLRTASVCLASAWLLYLFATRLRRILGTPIRDSEMPAR